jgi:hypothetical protein
MQNVQQRCSYCPRPQAAAGRIPGAGQSESFAVKVSERNFRKEVLKQNFPDESFGADGFLNFLRRRSKQI